MNGPDSERNYSPYSPEQAVKIMQIFLQVTSPDAIRAVGEEVNRMREDSKVGLIHPGILAEEVTGYVEEEFTHYPLPERAGALLVVPELVMPLQRRVELFHQSLASQAAAIARLRAQFTTDPTLIGHFDTLATMPAQTIWKAFESVTGLHTEMPQSPQG